MSQKDLLYEIIKAQISQNVNELLNSKNLNIQQMEVDSLTETLSYMLVKYGALCIHGYCTLLVMNEIDEKEKGIYESH
jgi:Flp pilus assembly CpaF family ATPase